MAGLFINLAEITGFTAKLPIVVLDQPLEIVFCDSENFGCAYGDRRGAQARSNNLCSPGRAVGFGIYRRGDGCSALDDWRNLTFDGERFATAGQEQEG